MSLDYRNLADVVAQLRAAGLLLETVKKGQGGAPVGEVYVESARSVRCDVAGEKKKQTGAYRLHELRLPDGIWITGAYWTDHGNHYETLDLRKTCEKCGTEMALKERKCPSCGSTKAKKREITPEQLEAHKKRMAELRRQADADAKADADRAAAWANAVWLKCREAEQPEDAGDYIARKKLKCAHGARILDSNDGIVLEGAEKSDYEYLARFHGARVIPMCDERGNRRGLQFILSRSKHKDFIASRDGNDKVYWPRGMLNEGLHYIIGGAMHRVGLVAEGFATGASLREATNLPVAVAFDANGLGKTGERIWKSKKKRINLLYAADDDWLQRCVRCGKYTPVETDTCTHCGEAHGKGNAGVTRAREAALATSGAWVAPVFSAPRPADRKGLTDFNDLRVAEGEQPVRAQIEAKLAELGWGGGVIPPSGAGHSATGGAGDGGGDDSGALPRPKSVMSLDEIVAQFVPLYCGRGKHLFDTASRIIVHKDQVIELLPPGVRYDEIKRHPTWIERGAYYMHEVGFDPSGKDAMVKLNTWRGWPLRARKGSCERLLELLEYNCSREENAAEVMAWLLKWVAYPLQHPGAKMQSAIIMHGPQGTGKSMFWKAVAKIYGDGNPERNYSVILDQSALESNYNSEWDSKLFVLAEEVVNSSDKWQLKNELKELVTGGRIRIERKFVDAYFQTNRCNMSFLSNENQPLPIENDDRRHCVVMTPHPLSEEFYAEVKAEMREGGIEALYHHLLNLDLTGFHPWTKPPMTQAKRNLIELSLSSEDAFLNEWIGGRTEHPVCPCYTRDLYRAYVAWCRLTGESRARNERSFVASVKKRKGWEILEWRVARDEMNPGKSTNTPMVALPEQAMADAAARGEADLRRSAEQTIQKWATECFFTFRRSLSADV